MSLHVQRQMVTPGEAPLADDALERFGTGVFTVVPRQLIGPRETPLALGPLAGVRLFACQIEDEEKSQILVFANKPKQLKR